MRPGFFIQTGLIGHEREESLRLIGKLLPSTIVLVRKDFTDRKDLIDLLHSIKRLYRIEKDAKDPYIAVDQEGGNVVRLAFLNYNPSNAFLGNLNNMRFTEYVGSRTGYDLRDLGIDWDLAPVLDLSSPYNQVILERSFSYDPLVVAAHGKAFIRGIQRYGVAATAKHFPGHGGVLGDSHLILPKDERGKSAIMSDMIPFKEAVQEGVASIMLSHVLYTAIDDSNPATLSPAIYNILRKDIKFKGLAITDSLNMKAVSKDFTTEEMGKRASMAGADILECVDIDRAMEMSLYLDMKDEHASAERILNLLPAKEAHVEPPNDVLNAFALVGNSIKKAFVPLNPETRTAVLYLDDTRESIVGDSFTNSRRIIKRLKETGLRLDSFTSEDPASSYHDYEQMIVIGRNEHLKDRYTTLVDQMAGKKSVFISTGVPADLGLFPDGVGYISTFSTKVEAITGAVFRAFGYF
ncbi:MAG: glycoside hydrolase family 3 N-terminal domain-containing protein [Thermoplasmata archaeon]